MQLDLGSFITPPQILVSSESKRSSLNADANGFERNMMICRRSI